MTIEVQAAWVASVYLMSLRFGTLILVGPIFSGISGLVNIRVLFTLAMSLVFVSALPTTSLYQPTDLGMFVLASMQEVFVGMTLAFGVLAAFAAFSVAGKVFDIQSGLGIGSVFDPVTRSGAALSATMFNMLAVAVFFGMEGHHALMRGIAFSAEQVPLGQGFSVLSPELAIRQFGLAFSLGMTLIAPVIFCLFMIEAILAVLSRVLPQMNAFIVGVPLKIAVGIAVLALAMETIAPVMRKIYAAIFRFWEQVLFHG